MLYIIHRNYVERVDEYTREDRTYRFNGKKIEVAIPGNRVSLPYHQYYDGSASILTPELFDLLISGKHVSDLYFGLLIRITRFRNEYRSVMSLPIPDELRRMVRECLTGFFGN